MMEISANFLGGGDTERKKIQFFAVAKSKTQKGECNGQILKI